MCQTQAKGNDKGKVAAWQISPTRKRAKKYDRVLV